MKKWSILLIAVLLVLTSCAGGDVSEVSQDPVSSGEQSEVSIVDEASKEVSNEESLPAEESEVSAEESEVSAEESEVSADDTTVPEESEVSAPEETSKEPDTSEPEKTDDTVEQALKLIDEGKIKESYELLYKSGSASAKEMLKDFIVVYTKETVSDTCIEYTYDDNGFLIRYHSPSITQTYTNDENGNHISSIYEYTSDYSGTQTTVRRENTFTYDNNGNMIKSVSVSETDVTVFEYEYDHNKNVVFESYKNEVYGIDMIDYYRYDYDDNGNVIKKYEVCLPGTEDEWISGYQEFFYDNAGILIKEQSYACQSVEPETKFYPNGMKEYFYDEYGLLIRVEGDTTNTVTYSDYLYFYRPQK